MLTMKKVKIDEPGSTGMMTGAIKSNGNSSGKAVFSYKIKGVNGISIVSIDAYKENGIWNYNKIIFYKEKKSSDVINLLEEN